MDDAMENVDGKKLQIELPSILNIQIVYQILSMLI